MNQRIQPTAASALLRGDTPSVLSKLARPGVAAAVWERALPAEITAALDETTPSAPPRLRRTVTRGALGRVLADWAAVSNLAGEGAAFLIADARFLALAFMDLLAIDAVQVRIDVIRDEGCARFHIDNVRARLLCTYRGPGTEYAEAGPLAHGPISRLARGAVGVFRGARWSPTERTTLLHRSPPPGETDAARLLLVIDPPDHGCDCC